MSRRIALWLHRFGIDNPTGVHRYALELARAMTVTAPADADVELWSGRVPGAPELTGVRSRHPRFDRRLLHLSWTTLHAPAFERVAGEVALVHALAPVVPVPSRAPFVVTVHDVWPLQHPEWYDAGPRWLNRRALRFTAAEAAAIITPSHAVARDVTDVLHVDPARIRVVPEGVDARFSTPAEAAAVQAVCTRFGVKPDRFLVVVGFIGPRKNLSVLFEALRDIRSRGGQLPPLLVVGGDELRASDIRAMPAALGVDDVVRFAGRVTDEELVPLMQAARALVHPATYEGFGLTPLEAMAAGTAVVSSSAGALPEVVGDAGLLVDPQDVGGWAEAIERIWTDDAEVRRAVDAGRARAAGFVWEDSARRTWQIYSEVCAW